MYKYYLMTINPNFRRIKVFFNTEFGTKSFINELKREGPVDVHGNILPVLNEAEYKENSVQIIKIDTRRCKYYRKMFSPMNEKAKPDIYIGRDLRNYLTRNDPDGKYNKHRIAA